MLFTFSEAIDIIIMSLFVGYIFSDMFKPFTKPSISYMGYSYRRFDIDSFKLAILVTAPAIIFHELGHKFIAIYFGFYAKFNAAYLWLTIGALLKFLGFNFIFFVPAYVSIYGQGTHLQYAVVALAGPLTNLLMYFISDYVVKQRLVSRRNEVFFIISKKINLFLFIFNLIPFPGFDGFQVIYHLIKAIA